MNFGRVTKIRCIEETLFELSKARLPPPKQPIRALYVDKSTPIFLKNVMETKLVTVDMVFSSESTNETVFAILNININS